MVGGEALYEHVFPAPPKKCIAPIKPFLQHSVFYFAKNFCQDFLLFILYIYANPDACVIKTKPTATMAVDFVWEMRRVPASFHIVGYLVGGIHRCLVRKRERLHHVQRSLLVFSEVR